MGLTSLLCALCYADQFVRGQVFNDDGTAANDYLFEHNCLAGTTLHVRSAPSPACTSSMAIAIHVVNTAAKDFDWDKAN